MFRVTESIHHGDYRHTQSSYGDSVLEAFVEALALSPYNFSVGMDNRYAICCYSDLVVHGAGSFGWARYTVEEIKPQEAAT
jgi:hypothetical protein